MQRYATLGCLLVLLAFAAALGCPARGIAADEEHAPLLVVVMDPLAAPLSCPCVEGYAQREYEKLAAFLQVQLDRPVDVTFAEALSVALKKHPGRQPDLIIGKDSVVRADASKARLPVTHVAALTGKDGATTQTGLIVVASDDPATQVSDLTNHRFFFGSADAAEKHAAAVALLKAAGVKLPKQRETTEACSEGACKVLDLRGQERAAAVISSYAKPLLEGCGTVKKGELKVVGETQPVPFIGAFVSSAADKELQERLAAALLQTGGDAPLCTALETMLGFVPPDWEQPADAKKKSGL